MLGILLVDKPIGCTSHDVVNIIRRRFGLKRVGHAGTLDPLASGLLVIAVGPATRFLQYLPLEPKVYEADIEFGKETASYDREGEVILDKPVPADLETKICTALPSFLGLISQLPPMFSAVKVNGKPLYKYARTGKEVEREARNVHISRFDIASSGPTTVSARIECSGGTYIRTLAHDLGQAVGCGAHLSGLRRTGVGRFHLDQAIPLEAAAPENLIGLEKALLPMPMIELTPSQTHSVREGRQIGISDEIEGKLAALVEPGYGVFSVARVHGNLLQPECVIPIEAAHGAI